MNRSCHLSAGYLPLQRVLNLDQKNHGKVNVPVIVMPLSRRGFIIEQEVVTSLVTSIIGLKLSS